MVCYLFVDFISLLFLRFYRLIVLVLLGAIRVEEALGACYHRLFGLQSEGWHLDS